MKKFAILLLALLLALALCASLLPAGAMAADVEYGVFVGETQVTSGNAADVLGNGKVSYDAGSNTLKLDGAVVGSIIFNAVSEDASVEFTGDNTVGGVIVLLILGVSLLGEGLQRKQWGR